MSAAGRARAPERRASTLGECGPMAGLRAQDQRQTLKRVVGENATWRERSKRQHETPSFEKNTAKEPLSVLAVEVARTLPVAPLGQRNRVVGGLTAVRTRWRGQVNLCRRQKKGGRLLCCSEGVLPSYILASSCSSNSRRPQAGNVVGRQSRVIVSIEQRKYCDPLLHTSRPAPTGTGRGLTGLVWRDILSSPHGHRP